MPSDRYSWAGLPLGVAQVTFPIGTWNVMGIWRIYEGLVVGLGVLVQELQQAGFHLEPDGIHPLNAVAILGRVQAELPDGFVALPVGLDRRQKLVPGEPLGVEDEVLDGGQAVNRGGFAKG